MTEREPCPECGAPGLDYEARVEQMAVALHRDCELEWDALAALDPGRLLTLHMADAHYGKAHDLTRRIWPGLDASHLAAALWAEFGWASPDADQGRPRLLDPDDPYWQLAADRLIAQLADPNIARAVSRIPRLAAALRGQP